MDRIIVATQVVEAGVDISAGCLITELAPWPSLVQRFGRCARYGGAGSVLVVDRRKNAEDAAPYSAQELESAWETIRSLQDVGIKSIEAHERSLEEAARQRLYPYTPAHLLLRKEFDELFDTTPDLTGADLDISRFLRSGDDRDLQVFWLEIDKDKKGEKPKKPPEDYKAQRQELCAVPFLQARDWLCEKNKSKLKASKRAWMWDWLDGDWIVATREALLPGRVICVAADSGGYRPDCGFAAESTDSVRPVPKPEAPGESQALEEAEDQQDGEIPGEKWKTIACHTQEVVDQTRQIALDLDLPRSLQELLQLAAVWHDWGKSHPAFQNMLRRKRQDADPFKSYFLAKSKKTKPSIRARYFAGENETDERCGYRHELASALGLFALLDVYAPKHDALLGPWLAVLQQMKQSPPERTLPPSTTPLIQRLLKCSAEEFDLVAYLVASHHGKVRVGLHGAPKDQDYRIKQGDKNGLPIRGVREGDRLPSVELVPGEPPIPEVTLTLEPAKLGLSSKTGISWRERYIGLMERHGPAALAFLEAILRAADVRASRLTTNDPVLAAEGKA
ncbi:MAG TPA: CRISPR-associated endonuclease Cas3'' [Gemmataceae bacterium]|nr:CRISPR-associated endonuclease Cas3'' [Gemmataceae bacterium]